MLVTKLLERLRLPKYSAKRHRARRKAANLFEQLETRTLLAGVIAETMLDIDAAGNLVITDINAGSSDDSLTLFFDTENQLHVIQDPTQVLSTAIESAIQLDAHTVHVPNVAFSGAILVNTVGGSDSLTLDFSLGIPSRTLIFDGGEGDDSLTIERGTRTSAVDTVTHRATSASAGAVVIDVDGPEGATAPTTVEYTNLEPISDNLNVNHRVFQFTGADETIILGVEASVVKSPLQLYDLQSRANATTATTFANLAGNPGGPQFRDGDVIEISGTDTTGANVTGTYTVTDRTTDSLQDLLERVELVYGGTATAAMVNGQIEFTAVTGVLSPIADVSLRLASHVDNTGNVESAPFGVFFVPQVERNVIDSTLSESVYFASPNVSLRIETSTLEGGGADTVYVDGIDPSSNADLTIVTDANDDVAFRKQPFVMLGGDLSIEAQSVSSEVDWNTNGGAVSVLALDGVIDIHSVQSNADFAEAGSEGGSITLTALGNVTAGTLNSSGNSLGGAVTVTSTTGAIDIRSSISTYGAASDPAATSQGGSITLTASSDVTTSGSLSSSGAVLGGNISIVSTNGLINTRDLFSRAFLPSGSKGGAIVLASHSTIEFGDIYSSGSEGGDITIAAGGDIVARGTARFEAYGSVAGGDISVTSVHGGISSNNPSSRLDINGRGFSDDGGSISLTASRDIIVGDLRSSGTHQAGDVTVTSSAGTIEVDGIFSSGNSSEPGSQGGSITLTALGNVVTGITLDSSGNSLGGAVTVTSTTGAIDIRSSISTYGAASDPAATSQGGSITLTASSDVTTSGSLSSSGALLGGNISIVSTNGLINTRDLFSRAFLPSGSKGGAIVLASHSTVELGDIYSSGSEGGDITVAAGGDIVARGTARFEAYGSVAGGDISVTSVHGGISSNNPSSRLDINGRGFSDDGGSISLTASRDIIVGDLRSSGTHQAGDVTVTSSAGTIEVDSIFSSANSNEPGSQGGTVSLTAYGNVQTISIFSGGYAKGGNIFISSTNGSIDNRSIGSQATYATAGVGGDVSMVANGTVAAYSLNSQGGDILVSGASFNIFSATSASGDIEFSVDAITVDDEIRGSGRLLIHPRTPGTTLGIGGGVGNLSLDDATLARLGSGFESITLGDAQTGAVDIGGFGHADATAALRGQFKLDDGAGTAAVNEVRTQAAALVNMDPLTAWVSSDLPPVIGGNSSALRFDGVDDYVDTRVVPYGTAFTVAFWVKGEAQNSTQPAIVSWGADSIPGGLFEVGVEPSTGRLTVDVGSGAAVGTANVLDGNWHQVVVRIADDGSPNVNEIELFVDGQVDRRSAADNQEFEIRTGFYFARIADTVTGESDRNFTGLLDEVRIYESALSDSELRVFFEEIDVLFHAPVSIIGETIKVEGLDANANEVHLTAVGGGAINDGLSGVDVTGSSAVLDGKVAPGTSSGGLVVAGDFTFAPTSSFEVDINGTTPDTEHDQLVVSGDNRVITLGGAQLNISLVTPPAIGSEQTYTIVDSTGTGSSISGVFKDGSTELNDGDRFSVGATDFRINYLDSGDVILTEVGNTPPTIDVSDTVLSYVENAVATRDDAAIASDEQANWDGGTLVAHITANAEASDRLSLLTVGEVTLVANNVKVSGVTVGTTSAASVMGATAMVITFNISADNAAVQEVVRAFGFDSTSENPSTAQRTLTFTITDSLSESSNDTLQIDVTAVNDAPAVSVDHVSVVINEGETAVNSGAFDDVDSDGVPLTASVGTVIDNLDGTWAWSWDTSVGTAESQTVTITATDTDHAATTVDFDLTVLPRFIVTNTNDSGPGSLRGAIEFANSHPGPDTILFNIPTSDPGFIDVDSGLPGGDAAADAFVIRPLSSLPSLNDTTGGTTIDGRTQSMFTGNTNPFGPEIVLDGSSADDNGLAIYSDNNNVFGLNIQAFPTNGIYIPGGNANWIAGNFLGTDATGTRAVRNGYTGVRMSDFARNNRIGTNGDGVADIDERNVISGNGTNGVAIPNAFNNVVAGNFIGTDATGTSSIANGLSGVFIWVGSSGNLVGTNGDGLADDDEGNVISGNSHHGVGIANARDNVVAGNFIGIDVTGTIALGNGFSGVRVWDGARNNRVGTNGDGVDGVADAAERNVISGNSYHGVEIADNNGTSFNVVAGNYIGTNEAGTGAVANLMNGVQIWNGAHDNLIGTDGDGVADAAERNVISGNVLNGVAIADGNGTVLNTVAGNFIGIDANGVLPLGNGRSGVSLRNGAKSNFIGSDGDGNGDAAERNVISANGFLGVEIVNAGTDLNVVAGNFIGTDYSGTADLGNVYDGIAIWQGAQFNRVGTDGSNDAFNAGERNVISGNNRNGVYVLSAGTNFNSIAGNYIGSDRTGTIALANGTSTYHAGVLISEGAQSNRIGTNGDGIADDEELNLISGNTGSAILLASAGTSGNVAAGNYLGTDVFGTAALGNGFRGVYITGGAEYNLIGTNGDGVADQAERNIISGNKDRGMWVSGARTSHNVIAGNYIGVDKTGLVGLGNGTQFYHSGITFAAGASSNLVGTDGDGTADAAERNVISGNTGYGVLISGAGTDANVVAGNYIGTNVSGTVAIPNTRDGVGVGTDAQFNIVGTNGDGVGDSAEHNVISGNAWRGVYIGVGDATGNVVAGNLIGLNAAGTGGIANGRGGVQIDNRAHSNRIGTNADGVSDSVEANRIAFNSRAGVTLSGADTTGNSIRQNSIYSNGGLAINLTDGIEDTFGVTANDPDDTDVGPNNLQNFPALALAFVSNSTLIEGSLNSTPSTTFTIELFSSAAADPSGFGEGETFLGSTVITTDTAGDSSFSVTFATVVPVGHFITATATDSAGNTSEFSGALITVDNRPPTAVAGGPYTVGEGGSIQLDASSSADPDQTSTTLSYEWDLDGDGLFGETGINATRGDEVGVSPNFSAAGLDGPTSVTVSLLVTDEGGLISLDTSAIHVYNVAPTANAGSDQIVNEGSMVSLVGSFTDPGDVDTHTFLWQVSSTNGRVIADSVLDDFSFTPMDNGVYTIDYTVTDDDGGSNTDQVIVTVDNVAPTLDVSGPQDAVRGQTVFVSGIITDPGVWDTHTVSIDWGDGTVDIVSNPQDSFAGSHIYAVEGTYVFSVTATDNDLGQTVVEQSVLISVVAMQGVDLAVGGTSAADSIKFLATGNSGGVEVRLNGVSLGRFQPTGRLLAFGQAGDDDIQIAANTTLSAWLYGGDGDDRLKGGAGHDVILGEAGDDLLVGGGSRDLLIGGRGADRILGKADDDILIAGYTVFDSDALGILPPSHQQSLFDVMAEWTSERDYEIRVANLINGSGSTDRLNGMIFLRTEGEDATVFDDEDNDVLSGLAGSDWFFFNTNQDRATDLKDEIFANDLDFLLS